MSKRSSRRDAIRSVLGAASFIALQNPAGAAVPTPTDGSSLATGLGSLPILDTWDTRSVSPENPTGDKGNGARAVPKVGDPGRPFADAAGDLGQGWNVRPFLKPKSGQTVTIMDATGPVH